jgi:hypothetical protein
MVTYYILQADLLGDVVQFNWGIDIVVNLQSLVDHIVAYYSEPLSIWTPIYNYLTKYVTTSSKPLTEPGMQYTPFMKEIMQMINDGNIAGFVLPLTDNVYINTLSEISQDYSGLFDIIYGIAVPVGITTNDITSYPPIPGTTVPPAGGPATVVIPTAQSSSSGAGSSGGAAVIFVLLLVALVAFKSKQKKYN